MGWDTYVLSGSGNVRHDGTNTVVAVGMVGHLGALAEGIVILGAVAGVDVLLTATPGGAAVESARQAVGVVDGRAGAEVRLVAAETRFRDADTTAVDSDGGSTEPARAEDVGLGKVVGVLGLIPPSKRAAEVALLTHLLLKDVDEEAVEDKELSALVDLTDNLLVQAGEILVQAAGAGEAAGIAGGLLHEAANASNVGVALAVAHVAPLNTDTRVSAAGGLGSVRRRSAAASESRR